MALHSGASQLSASISIAPSTSRPHSVVALSAHPTCLSTRTWTQRWCCPVKKLRTRRLRSGSLGIVVCLPASTSEEGTASPEPLPTKKLFVSGLSFYTTEDSLRKCFSRFGQLTEVKVIMDKFAKRSKGFGFIEYDTVAEAEEAIKGMDGKFLDGRVIFVEVAKPRPSPLPRATEPPKFS